MEIPTSYREIIEPLIAKARGFLEAGESLSPFAFVGNFSGQMCAKSLDAESMDE